MNKTELTKLLELTWSNKSMVDHCLKSTEYIEHDGYFIAVGDKKPSITKTIWYDDETEAPELTEEMFVQHNMRTNAPKPMEALSFHGDPLLVIPQYFNDKTGGRLCGLTYSDKESYPNGIEVDEELLKEINKTREDMEGKYKKRLTNYYKRYKDHIHVSGYWVNR